MQSLREKGLMKTMAGQSSFSVLLFQDIAVIPMLAIFPLLATLSIQKNITGEHTNATWVEGQPGWIQTLIVIGSVASIVAKTGMREVFTALALLIVAGIAALMTKVGLSPALGAFLAGVVLANSEYRHELESDIEPFKGLLLGLFFIAVGASIDFPLIASQPWMVIGLVFLLIIIKTIVLLVLGRIFKLSAEQNFIFSFSLSQVGEFAFVLFSFALQEGILPQDTVKLLVAVVAISMGLTPLIMLINEKFILPGIGTEEKEQRAEDVIDEKNPVIIAGFGHFGNTVGRFLRANNVQATYLDLNSDTVDVLRKMGFKVFYGDASRHELLQSAGASEAKIIIIATGEAEKRLEMVETVKKHFPHLHILVRSTNRYDAYDLMNAGMLHVYRETLDTSVRVGVDALTLLGHRAYTAKRLARLFLKYDEKNLKKLASIHNEEEYISKIRKYIEEIELIIQSDRQDFTKGEDGAWDAESLREEIRARDSLASGS
jgi:Trk K+ transport system NAD-binding subunit